jgi:hypothetical protein
VRGGNAGSRAAEADGIERVRSARKCRRKTANERVAGTCRIDDGKFVSETTTVSPCPMERTACSTSAFSAG